MTARLDRECNRIKTVKLVANKKIRTLRWCWSHSSRPVARFRPSPTCSRCFPCGPLRAILARAPGSPSNRINQSNASGLYLAFELCSCSPRPARCYRPLLTFSFHPCGSRAISLEPRTLHQPEKLGNVSKNEYVFTLLIFRVNENIATLSPAESIECSSFTALCRNFVQFVHARFTKTRNNCEFSPTN
jgi:hypothetical protein